MSLLRKQLSGAHLKVLRPSGGCHNCPRRRKEFVEASLADGSILFIGETPEQSAVDSGMPFSGSTGNMLRRFAKEAGVPGPYSFTYSTHCRTPEAKATDKAVQCCLSQFVLDEIKNYSIVVLCGNLPLQTLFPGARADHFRGNVAWHPDFPNTRFYTTYAPGYIAQRPDLEDEFRGHIQRLGRIARGEKAPTWQLVRGAEALPALRLALQKRLASIDLETNRFESWAADGRIKSFSVTVDAETVIFGHEDEPHFAEGLSLIADYLEDEGNSVLGSHISFDLEWLERECKIRVKCQLIHDVGIQYYHAKQYKMPSLKELVSRELDGYRYLVHQPQHCQDVDLLARYNAEDVIYPLLLMRKAMKELRPKTRDLVARVLGPADLVLQQMTAAGFYMRQEYRAQKIVEYGERRRAVIKAWKDEDPEFIPTVHESGDGLLHYLYTIRGLPVLASTESGQASTDQSVLKQLDRDGHTIVRHLLEMRTIDKIESTYLNAYDKHLWPDSRIRSHYPLTWTDSGRSSSRSPNLQNIPRLKEIRDLFGVPAGSVLLESDLSQIEFRIMVCLAGDENGIQGYLRGEDAHTTTARAASGNPKPTKEQRSQAKPINFGFLYGAWWTMVQQLVADEYGVLWTDEEAARFRELFFETYPSLPLFHEDSARRLIQNQGWFESVVGHVFHYEDWNHPQKGKADHARRAALNAEAQGPAAQICMYIMVLARRLLDQRGFRSVKFVNYVHDSIMTEVPNPVWVPDVVSTLNEATALAHRWVKQWFIVPLIMDHKVGESWGSLQDYKAA